jgi:hypothetical protein
MPRCTPRDRETFIARQRDTDLGKELRRAHSHLTAPPPETLLLPLPPPQLITDLDEVAPYLLLLLLCIFDILDSSSRRGRRSSMKVKDELL